MVTWLKLTFCPPIGAWLIRMLGVLTSLRYEGAEIVEKLHQDGHPVIFAFWHNRQLLMPLAYRGSGAYALISQHRDGELIARIVERLGVQAVRGSSTRGGAAALRELIRAGRSGADLAITPDGPKGPRYVAKLGVVQLAKAIGAPIVPVTFACSKKKVFASWDRFEVPLPFGRGLFRWGEPIWVAADATDADLEVKRIELEAALNRLTADADQAVMKG